MALYCPYSVSASPGPLMTFAKARRTAVPEGHELLNEDEKHLAKLGYVQELNRTWSGFSNFAISFSIISILAGCFTSFGLGWNNGGPAAIAWGWPIVSIFILIIGLCMSELVSAYPTSGGIYWWAAKLGGPKAGFYTGWLNLIGLIAILASVAYGCATFLDLTLGTFSEGWLAGYSLTRTFGLFVIILAASAIINIFSSHLLAVINNISVWWHVDRRGRGGGDPDLHPRAARQFLRRLRPDHQQHRHVRWGEGLRLVDLRAADRGDPDPVHDHRLRRVRAPVGGDPQRGQWGGQGYLAVDLLFGDRRLDPAAGIPLRGAGRRRGVRQWRRGGDDLQPGAQFQVGRNHPADLGRRTVLLHHRLPDQRLANAVRVQPRPGSARATSCGRR